MANREHLAVARQGPEALHEWRTRHPGTRLDLTRADLTVANLFGANLTGANLIVANLTVANLTGSHPHQGQSASRHLLFRPPHGSGPLRCRHG